MLAETLMALAALAGNTVVAAATTDAWEAARRGFARLLGRGDPDRTSTGRRRRAYEHEDPPWHYVTASPPALLGAHNRPLSGAFCRRVWL